MDSLLATYASSDEDDEQPPPTTTKTTTTTTTTTTNHPTKPPSLFSLLPKPQSSTQQQQQDPKTSSKFSSFFSYLPKPISQTTPNFSSPNPNPKRVVQFHPPLPQPSTINPKNEEEDDEEEEDKEERDRKRKRQMGQDTCVKSFLSTMPAPKNSLGSTLGALPTVSGSTRRSMILETKGDTLLSSGVNEVKTEVGFESNQENVVVDVSNSYGYEMGVVGDQSYGSYDSYDGSVVAETSVSVESFVSNMGGKRRKDQAPIEIIEVKQDELMKNRPREDKSRSTGIAFGPSYQPASTKGKLSKQHKRKHQIGALYFDMRQKEMELAERRSKGLLTKAETQAKYGW